MPGAVPAAEPVTPNCVHLAEEANWPPFTLESGGMASKGFSWELAQLVFGHLGRCVDVELLPMQRLLLSARKGKRDGITLISLNPERAAFLAFTSPAVMTRRAFVYHRSDRVSPIVMSSWEDLRGLKVAIVGGRNYPAAFQEARQQGVFTVMEVVAASQMFELLMRGRIDALLSLDMEAADFLIQPAYQGEIVPSVKPYLESNYYLAISRQSALVQSLPEINQAITELQFNGKIPALLQRYGL
jgi:ABC-type amino acid transport substrate-binding protein